MSYNPFVIATGILCLIPLYAFLGALFSLPFWVLGVLVVAAPVIAIGVIVKIVYGTTNTTNNN